MWAGVSKGAAVPGWTLDFEWGLLVSLGGGCPGIGLNRCPSQCPELGALETRFGCHFLYKGSAPDVDTWKMHSQGVALRGCHLSTLACGSGQAVPSVQSHPSQGQDELLGDLTRWWDGSQQIVLIFFMENTLFSQIKIFCVPSLPATVGLAISYSDGWPQIIPDLFLFYLIYLLMHLMYDMLND